MKRISTVLMAMVVSFGLISFGGCKEDKIGTFYEIDEAYRMQLLTRRDIMHIAYYHGGVYLTPEEDGLGSCQSSLWTSIEFTPDKPLGELSEETEQDIKRAYYRNFTDNFSPDKSEEEAIADIKIKCCGEFDGKYAVSFLWRGNAVLLSYAAGGVAFYLDGAEECFLFVYDA